MQGNRLFPRENDCLISFAGQDVTQERAEVARLTEERAQAKWQEQMKGHMLATMSHDLRSPVHAIIAQVRF